MTTLVLATGMAGAAGAGLVFAEAGLAKLRHRDVLPGVVANYRLLPEGAVDPVAAALPWVEIVLALALLAGVAGALPAPVSAGAALLAAGLLVLFAGAIAINLRRGRSHIDCGCGRSQLRQPLNRGMVVRNLVLAALVAVRIVPQDSAPGFADIALALVAGLAIWLLTVMFNTISALAQSPLARTRSS